MARSGKPSPSDRSKPKVETRELPITTHYAPVIRKWRGDDSSVADTIRDFRVVLPRSEICSARLFDPKVYVLFRQER